MKSRVLAFKRIRAHWKKHIESFSKLVNMNGRDWQSLIIMLMAIGGGFFLLFLLTVGLLRFAPTSAGISSVALSLRLPRMSTVLVTAVAVALILFFRRRH